VSAHRAQILEELNVKTLDFIARDAELVRYRIKPHLPRVGRRYGRLVPAIREALAAADGAAIAAAVAREEAFVLEAGGQSIELGPDEVLVETESAEGYACAEEGGYLVALDTTVDDVLRREGLARELVRTVQDARKQADLVVSDRIALQVTGTPGVEAALAEYRAFVMTETLASQWIEGEFPGGDETLFRVERQLGDEHWTIRLRREPGAGGG
jgi:isoleucyl-tRNA synthetase